MIKASNNSVKSLRPNKSQFLETPSVDSISEYCNFSSPRISSFSPSPPNSPSTSPIPIDPDDEIIDNTIKKLLEDKAKENENPLNNPNKVIKPLSYLYKEPNINPSKKVTRPSSPMPIKIHDSIDKLDLVDIPKTPESSFQIKTSLPVKKIFNEIALNLVIVATGIIMFFFCTNPFTAVPFLIIVIAYVIIVRLLVFLGMKIINYLCNIIKNSKVSSK